VESINTLIKYVAMKIRVPDFTSSENQKNRISKHNLFVLKAEYCVVYFFVFIFTELTVSSSDADNCL
jgi:hypothetical protein